MFFNSTTYLSIQYAAAYFGSSLPCIAFFLFLSLLFNFFFHVYVAFKTFFVIFSLLTVYYSFFFVAFLELFAFLFVFLFFSFFFLLFFFLTFFYLFSLLFYLFWIFFSLLFNLFLDFFFPFFRSFECFLILHYLVNFSIHNQVIVPMSSVQDLVLLNWNPHLRNFFEKSTGWQNQGSISPNCSAKRAKDGIINNKIIIKWGFYCIAEQNWIF